MSYFFAEGVKMQNQKKTYKPIWLGRWKKQIGTRYSEAYTSTYIIY